MSQQNKTNDQEEFQIFVSKQDFEKLKAWEIRYQEQQKNGEKLKKQIQTLHKNLQIQKKCTYIRKQEVNYLVGRIGLYCDSIVGGSSVQFMGDISKSCYQDLVEKKQEGMSMILGHQIYDSFQDNHMNTLSRLADVQKKVLWYKSQFERLSKIQLQRQKLDDEKSKKLVSMVQQVKDTNKFAKVDQDLMSQLLKQKNLAQNKLKYMKKDFDELVKQNLQFQREIKQLKAYKKKLSDGEKSYQIKLLIDQYYRDLQNNLKQLGGLQRKQIQTVVQNEFKGIKQYIDNLTKHTYVPISKKR